MDTTTAKVLAPEDISPGDYVAPLTVLFEVIDYWRECRTGPPEACRIPTLPCSFTPYVVVSVCLPFVLVEDNDGDRVTLDVRRYTLARLDEEFGELVMKKDRKSSRA